jgi:L-ribulose-5-phosphate 4-epimerase
MEECAWMAAQALRISPSLTSLDQALLDKHYFRKHGSGAYYGQR